MRRVESESGALREISEVPGAISGVSEKGHVQKEIWCAKDAIVFLPFLHR